MNDKRRGALAGLFGPLVPPASRPGSGGGDLAPDVREAQRRLEGGYEGAHQGPTGEDERLAEIRLILPWPPSINRYWRCVGQGVLLSSEGRAYRELARIECMTQLGMPPRLRRRLFVAIVTHAPTLRAYDLDNRLKSLLDALEHGGVYLDDGQIDKLEVSRGAVLRPAGRVVVRVAELP